MKKVMYFVMLATLLFAGCKNNDFEAKTVFSVSESKQVHFAKGNLEYDSIGGYHFAANQYDYGGYFGWGTGSNPTLTSIYDRDYPTFDDWGNHIAGGWRTLSWDEWHYVILDRADASAKRGAATVCGAHGIVLLPDNFSGGTFNAGFDFDNRWSWNVYDASSWSDMETAGAVFLPAAGYRRGTELDSVGTYGTYWSSTPVGTNNAWYVFLFELDVLNGANIGRGYGRSVRLVQDI